MKTFLEWLVQEYHSEGIDCDITEVEKWLRSDFEELISGYHYGDCTKQNVSCKICELQNQLDDYYNYVKRQIQGQ